MKLCRALVLPGVAMQGCLKPWVQPWSGSREGQRGAFQGPGLQEAGRDGAHQGQVQPRELCLQHERAWRKT